MSSERFDQIAVLLEKAQSEDGITEEERACLHSLQQQAAIKCAQDAWERRGEFPAAELAKGRDVPVTAGAAGPSVALYAWYRESFFHYGPSLTAVYRRFGSYANLLKAAGFTAT